MSPAPCDCCPIDQQVQRCALVQVLFDAVAQTAAGAAGWSGPVNLAATIDGITATAALSGYNVAGNPPPAPTPVVEYTLTADRDLVRGVRLWNQAGGDHGDFDGLGPTTVVTFLDAASTVLYTGNLAAGNGGAPFTTLIPGGAVLNGVKTVRLSSLGKQSGSSVAPLWREFELLQVQPVFPCRRANSALEWYSLDGTLVPAADMEACPP